MAMQTTTTTNPVELLKADHQKVKGLFSQFESAGEDKKADIFKQIVTELQVHTKVEEEIFYPAVKKMDSDMALEAEEEHNIVDWIIAQMKKLSPGDENYDAKFTTLKENVEHHIEEEEKEMFPEAQQKLPAKQMDELGKKMMARKEALMKRATSSSAAPRSRAAAKPRSRAKAASR